MIRASMMTKKRAEERNAGPKLKKKNKIKEKIYITFLLSMLQQDRDSFVLSTKHELQKKGEYKGSRKKKSFFKGFFAF